MYGGGGGRCIYTIFAFLLLGGGKYEVRSESRLHLQTHLHARPQKAVLGRTDVSFCGESAGDELKAGVKHVGEERAAGRQGRDERDCCSLAPAQGNPQIEIGVHTPRDGQHAPMVYGTAGLG